MPPASSPSAECILRWVPHPRVTRVVSGGRYKGPRALPQLADFILRRVPHPRVVRVVSCGRYKGLRAPPHRCPARSEPWHILRVYHRARPQPSAVPRPFLFCMRSCSPAGRRGWRPISIFIMFIIDLFSGFSCLHGRVCALGYRPKGVVGLPCNQEIVFVVVF